MSFKSIGTHFINSRYSKSPLFLSSVRLLLLYFFSAVTAYILMRRFSPWLDFDFYLLWPVTIWKDFFIRWLINDLSMVPSTISIGTIALVVILIFLTAILVWGIKLKNSWLSNALILFSLYTQILITCMLDSL